MIEWTDEAVAAALRVWMRISEVGEFRDVRWRETMRQALKAAVEAQNRPDVMGDALAKALLRATKLEIEAYRLKTENEKLRYMLLRSDKLTRQEWYDMRNAQLAQGSNSDAYMEAGDD